MYETIINRRWHPNRLVLQATDRPQEGLKVDDPECEDVAEVAHVPTIGEVAIFLLASTPPIAEVADIVETAI
jgi:hypothetical protein